MGIDVIYAAFRTDPVGSVFPCPEGPVGSVFPRHHSGTQRRIFRKEDGLDEKGVFHKSVTILFRGLFCQVGEPG